MKKFKQVKFDYSYATDENLIKEVKALEKEYNDDPKSFQAWTNTFKGNKSTIAKTYLKIHQFMLYEDNPLMDLSKNPTAFIPLVGELED